uniref:Uncharacterized protein n=1 Tax=Timema douglasi TaxID=61478 RepID=A0A7R8ZA53_TIMDO|nr:unnamed protein product [Timema douglasi]
MYGRFFEHPGDKDARSSAFFQLKMDEPLLTVVETSAINHAEDNDLLVTFPAPFARGTDADICRGTTVQLLLGLLPLTMTMTVMSAFVYRAMLTRMQAACSEVVWVAAFDKSLLGAEQQLGDVLTKPPLKLLAGYGLGKDSVVNKTVVVAEHLLLHYAIGETRNVLVKMHNWWNKRAHRSKMKDPNRKYTCWEEDFQLQDAGRLALFEEYLEMGEFNK